MMTCNKVEEENVFALCVCVCFIVWCSVCVREERERGERGDDTRKYMKKKTAQICVCVFLCVCVREERERGERGDDDLQGI